MLAEYQPAVIMGVVNQKPREIALDVLLRRERAGDFTENLLNDALARATLRDDDRRLAQELVLGAVRWQATLDWLIARKTAGRQQKPALQILLRLGLYQAFWLDRIPDHAVVNELVELTRRHGLGPQSGFVNAVLRGYLREREETERLLAELKTAQPHLGCSLPDWLVQRWQTRWDGEKLQALLEWNNTPPAVFARVNTLKCDAAALLDRWRMKDDVDYDFGRWDWLDEGACFVVKAHRRPMADWGTFQDGWFYAQDPSTLLAVTTLNPQPGETILDLCAAPGGKTTFIAQRMNNQGRLIATDNSPDRLKLVKENCARLGVTCAEIRSEFSASGSVFDRILVDAPCSNTGVLRRRVDARWRLRPEEIGRFAGTQLALLNRAAPMLKPGGTLVYSTCSLEPEENEGVVDQFLAAQPSFAVERQRTLLPFVERVDGAYVALLVRRA
jgi:16S rRNA (cytosine967-C5)-methyltransferase